MTASEPRRTGTTPALAPLAEDLAALTQRLGVKSVLVMRSDPDSMVVAATAGEATRHYTVGAAGKKAGADEARVPLYCERVVDADETLFVRDSRADPVFAGNEDETEFGLFNYLGLAVHDTDGNVVGTVCVLADKARDYTEADRAELERLRSDVEAIVRDTGTALG